MNIQIARVNKIGQAINNGLKGAKNDLLGNSLPMSC